MYNILQLEYLQVSFTGERITLHCDSSHWPLRGKKKVTFENLWMSSDKFAVCWQCYSPLPMYIGLLKKKKKSHERERERQRHTHTHMARYSAVSQLHLHICSFQTQGAKPWTPITSIPAKGRHLMAAIPVSASKIHTWILCISKKE